MKYILFFFLIFFNLSCGQEKEDSNKIIVNGVISNLPSSVQKVKLKRMGLNGPELVDSAEIEEGRFSVEITSDSDYLYRLEIGNSFLPLFLETGQHSLEADYKNLYQSANFSNSPMTVQMRRMESLRLQFEARAQELQGRFEMAYSAGREKGADSARMAYEFLRLESKNKIKSLIDSMGPGPVSYLAISMLDVEEDFGYLDSLAVLFEKLKPGRIYTQKINRFMENPRRFAIGKPAPDFNQPNPSGASVSLSSFRGKWILLDFWASWCKPCRAENPLLRDLNKRLNNKGFQIFSVSLDGDRESWMKAMVQDEMNWAHASDLKGWQNSAAVLYGISAIPASFLIDPEGRIAAKNLRGEKLRQKLVEIFP